MSMNYVVLVPEGQWPSFAQMNARLAARGYDLQVVPQGEQSVDDPMQEFGGFLSFDAIFRGELIEMDCYHRVLEEFVADEFAETLAEVGSDFEPAAGMHEWHCSFSPSIPPEFMPPNDVVTAILVLDFGGYGYLDRLSFGSDEWAEGLLQQADAIIAELDNAPPKPASSPAVPSQAIPPPTQADAVSPPPKGSPVPIGMIIGCGLILLAIASWVTQNS